MICSAQGLPVIVLVDRGNSHFWYCVTRRSGPLPIGAPLVSPGVARFTFTAVRRFAHASSQEALKQYIIVQLRELSPSILSRPNLAKASSSEDDETEQLLLSLRNLVGLHPGQDLQAGYVSLLHSRGPRALEAAIETEAALLRTSANDLSTARPQGKLAVTCPDHVKVRSYHSGAVLDVFFAGKPEDEASIPRVSLEFEEQTGWYPLYSECSYGC